MLFTSRVNESSTSLPIGNNWKKIVGTLSSETRIVIQISNKLFDELSREMTECPTKT